MGDFVVKKNETEELYLKHHLTDGPPNPPVFDVLAEAKEYDTLEDAQAVATAINAGTLGVPKPV